jgi:hypothetical protein
VLTINELNSARTRIKGKRAVLVPVPALWFVRDFVDGLHLVEEGTRGGVTWEEWLRTS